MTLKLVREDEASEREGNHFVLKVKTIYWFITAGITVVLCIGSAAISGYVMLEGLKNTSVTAVRAAREADSLRASDGANFGSVWDTLHRHTVALFGDAQ